MSQAFVFQSQSISQTRELGLQIGQHLQPATVIGLTGTLGTGKTNLTQSIAEGLGVDPRNVVSPTYTICIPYSARLNVLHLDSYRIKHDEEVDELGLDERVENDEVLIIEWIERIADVAPPVDLQIDLEQLGETEREFTLKGCSPLGTQLLSNISAGLSHSGPSADE